MSSHSSLDATREEMRRYPLSVSEEFQRASEAMGEVLMPDQLAEWGQQGLSIAKLTVRSWEAASEFFRVSPTVFKGVTFAPLMEWAGWGNTICQDSPTISVAYFRASHDALALLSPEEISGWARLGRTLYKGTWKSTTLATRFFESSPTLLKHLTFQELTRFTQLIETLSHRSYDLAVECLVLGRDSFPKMSGDKNAFLSLLYTMAGENWRQVKGSFEPGVRAMPRVEKSQRQRFLQLTQTVALHRGGNTPAFLTEAADALSQLEWSAHAPILTMAEALANPSPATVVEFLKSCPTVLSRVNEQQLAIWFGEGIHLLRENEDAGMAYFRIQSARSEEVLDNLSSGVELERIGDVLRMYCRALAGAEVDIALTQELVQKGIGWVSKEHPTTEGTTVFLPPQVDRYPSKEENFLWYKVVATHQVGHLEFGSFDFQFTRPSSLFSDLRTHLSLPQEGAESPSAMETNGAESAWLTDMSRFFDLFEDRKLVLDLFTLVEDARLDYLVKTGYAGIRAAYQRVQHDALQDRPAIESLPAREALMEFLVQLSLGAEEGLMVPEEYAEEASTITRITLQLLDSRARVEDTAEATIRLYQVLSQIPNEEAAQWEAVDLEEEKKRAQSQAMMDLADPDLPQGTLLAMPSEEGSPYQSPQDVEYRGDFKPELTQLLAQLRNTRGKTDAQGRLISREMLEELLKRSGEMQFQAAQGQMPPGPTMFANNLLREAGMVQSRDPDWDDRLFPHDGEEEGPLETTEPQTFLYNEWDFRASDYKPRWCIVREKFLAEGDTSFYENTLQNYATLINRVRHQFEMLMPEAFRKIKHLPDGEEFELDSVIEAIIDRKIGASPSDKLYWKRNKVVRDVAVVFLLDMSASTAEAIDDSKRQPEDWDAPDDPVEYMVWLRTRRSQGLRRPYKRIIDVEKESTVLLIRALETIGDAYGIYGFSGYGRENVEFYVIKDIAEHFSERVMRRIDKISPLHATRMGPAIRHATRKLEKQDARTKILFLISDGRPQDRGYSREGVEKEYAVHDTKMALNEARRKEIIPFCLTVDREGHDYLKTMAGDMGYEILNDITQLPERLPYLYRKLSG